MPLTVLSINDVEVLTSLKTVMNLVASIGLSTYRGCQEGAGLYSILIIIK